MFQKKCVRSSLFAVNKSFDILVYNQRQTSSYYHVFLYCSNNQWGLLVAGSRTNRCLLLQCLRHCRLRNRNLRSGSITCSSIVPNNQWGLLIAGSWTNRCLLLQCLRHCFRNKSPRSGGNERQRVRPYRSDTYQAPG